MVAGEMSVNLSFGIAYGHVQAVEAFEGFRLEKSSGLEGLVECLGEFTRRRAVTTEDGDHGAKEGTDFSEIFR